MEMIKRAPNIPRTTKALAMLGVSQMKDQELDVVLEITKEIEPMLIAGDWQGIRDKLNELDLPPDVIEMAEGLLQHGTDGNHNQGQ
jgi:hypothetical protein